MSVRHDQEKNPSEKSIKSASKRKSGDPLQSPKYLKSLRKKCVNWLDDFAIARSESDDNAIEDDFEIAFRASQGKPFAYDDGNMRSLHFDKRTMQSAMWISAPDELAFGYTRSMMGFLLSNDTPQHILIIGLGGGSLAKYCYKYLPTAQITVLEIDADVIALRKQFFIPDNDARLQIIHTDATAFVRNANFKADVILLDGFDADGMVSNLHSYSFYTACKAMLSEEGILVTNMWSESKNLGSTLGEMHLIFDTPIWCCKSSDSFNLIAFAFKSRKRIFPAELKALAQRLDQHFKLEFAALVERLHVVSSPDADPANDHNKASNARYLKELSEKVKQILAAENESKHLD